ncbi:MAG: T9SS type A sorting domain-containing protein, partial [Saprospiraceae bacterium]
GDCSFFRILTRTALHLLYHMLMCNKLLHICLLILSLTLLGVGLSAQGVPDYGIVRLQTAPELSFGSFPQQVMVFNRSVIIKGVGWDTLNPFTRGAYFSKYDGLTTETLSLDSARIRSLNDSDSEADIVTPTGIASIRNANYDAIDTIFLSSGAASILEYISSNDPDFNVYKIDTMWLTPEEVEEQRFFLTHGVRDFESSQDDSIRFLFSTSFHTSKPAIVELRTYVEDSLNGMRLVLNVPITSGIVPRDFQLGAWRMSDTLGRAQLDIVNGGNDLVLRQFDMHTGAPLFQTAIKESVGNPRVIPSGANGLGYAYDYFIDESNPQLPEAKVEVVAFDLRKGDIQWEKEFTSSLGWYVHPDFIRTRVDSAGKVLVTGFPSTRVLNSAGDFEYQVELRGADALTGDSLWATIVALDSFATEAHNIAPMDIAMKPNGEGYVVAAWVAESKLDPLRDLRYAYTALFFLDSLGCLAPGCRQPSSTKDAYASYEISLAPNPVRAGEQISVSFPEVVVAVRYAVTDAQGKRLGFSESEQTAGGKLDVQINDLPSGMYYLTVWPEQSGNAMLTRGFVVE